MKKTATAYVSESSGVTGLKPEETVRQSTIKELLRLGWKEGQLQWKPEWPVPKTHTI